MGWGAPMGSSLFVPRLFVFPPVRSCPPCVSRAPPHAISCVLSPAFPYFKTVQLCLFLYGSRWLHLFPRTFTPIILWARLYYPIHPAQLEWLLVYPAFVSHTFPARFPQYIPSTDAYFQCVSFSAACADFRNLMYPPLVYFPSLFVTIQLIFPWYSLVFS